MLANIAENLGSVAGSVAKTTVGMGGALASAVTGGKGGAPPRSYPAAPPTQPAPPCSLHHPRPRL